MTNLHIALIVVAVTFLLSFASGAYFGHRHGYRAGLLDMYRANKTESLDGMHRLLIREGITER